MKKIYSAFLILCSGAALQAQLTQTNNAPAAGDKFELYHCDSVTTNPGASGANALWNFSGVTTFSTLLRSYTVQAVNTSTYPSAPLALASANNDIAYLASSSGSLLYYGGNIAVGAITGGLTYTNPAVYASYPMSLNTSSSSPITGSLVIPALAATGTFSGSSTTVADGTGTINLPGSVSYNDAVRVVTSQTLYITTSLANATVTQVNYNYYSPTVRAPLFSISSSTAVIGGFFASTTTQTMVTRLKSPQTVTVGIAENMVNAPVFDVYPNPSVSQVNFVTNSAEAAQVSIFDITGKLIEKQNLNDGKVKLDVSSYNKGLYLYVITSGNNKTLKSGKITVSQ